MLKTKVILEGKDNVGTVYEVYSLHHGHSMDTVVSEGSTLKDE